MNTLAGLTEQDVENARWAKMPQRELNFVNEGMSVAYGAWMTEPRTYDVALEPPARTCSQHDLKSIKDWEKTLKAITREHGQAALTTPDSTGQVDVQAAVLGSVPTGTVTEQTRSSSTLGVPPAQGPITIGHLRDLLNMEQRRAHDLIIECMDNEANGK